MSEEVTFREATETDVDLILEFIKELAKYEHMENQVVATPEILKEQIFDKHGAEVIFALIDEQEVGFALFCQNFSTFLGRRGIWLEDLFVRPEFRDRGAGVGLLSKLAQIALEKGCGRLEWSCLDWNEPSIKFYLNMGAVPMDDWTTYRVDGLTLRGLAAIEENATS